MKFVIENLVELLNCKEYEIYQVGLNCIDLSYDLKPEILNIIEKIKHVFETYTIQFNDENYITLAGKWKNVFDTTYVKYNNEIFNPVKINEKIHSSLFVEKITNLISIQTIGSILDKSVSANYIALLDNHPVYLLFNENNWNPKYNEVYYKIISLLGDNEEEFNFKFQKLINEFHQNFFLNENIKYYEIWYLDDKTFDEIVSIKIKNEIINEQNKINDIFIDVIDLTYAGFILKEDLDEHIRTRS